MFMLSELLIQTIYSLLIGACTGFVFLVVGANSYKKRIASLGDNKGSIHINGRWYVIKREGE
jgi:hypothetical protein